MGVRALMVLCVGNRGTAHRPQRAANRDAGRSPDYSDETADHPAHDSACRSIAIVAGQAVI